METRPGFEYVAEAYYLGDGRYICARPDRPPFIIDFKTGETEDLEMPKVTGGYGTSSSKPSTKKGSSRGGKKGGKK
jgi:hypothetical protein